MTIKKKPERNCQDLQETTNEIVIPDLEELAEQFVLKEWTYREKAIVRKYYGRVPLRDLMKHLPGKTEAAIRNVAGRLGVTKERNLL